MEKRGIPAVAFVSKGFVRDAQRSAAAFGLPSLSLAVFPDTFTNRTPEELKTMIDQGFEQIVAGLTQAPGLPPAPSGPSREEKEVLSIPGEDLLDCLDNMNRTFLERGWTDGFPLLPPTKDRVARMLAGTTKRPDEVIGILEPGFGIATVERIAINAVMAGCRPEHLPIVIAAVKAVADPRALLRMMSVSTAPHAPLILVNGPIVGEVGLNSGRCALGPGAPSYVNTAIGRALRLCIINIGHTYPSVSEMDTIGTPAKYSMCVAENEQASPWQPYHVEKGFPKDASTVTVQFANGICHMEDLHNSDPDRLCTTFATEACNIGNPGTGIWLVGKRADGRNKIETEEHDLLLIGPQHAAIFARHGWGKDEIRQAVYKKARLPFGTLMGVKEPKALKIRHPDLAWMWEAPDTLVPVLEGPHCYEIAVVGASDSNGGSAFLWGAGEPNTKVIER